MGKWVKRQRRQYTQNQLPQGRQVALEEIGFDFKPGTAPTREERLNIQLGLLDSLRRRRELSNAQVQDLNCLYDEWKRRGLDRTPKPLLGQDGRSSTNKFDEKWASNFALLTQFQLKEGHCRVPQFHKNKSCDSNSPYKSLGKWVDYQRQSYWKRQEGKNSALTDERISKLESIGFEWRIRLVPSLKLEAKEEPNEDDNAEESESAKEYDFTPVFAQPKAEDVYENLHEHKWFTHLEELTRYKDLTGGMIITVNDKKHPVHGEELTKLSKWMDRQRALYKARQDGEKGGISKARIKRLEAIGFDFKAPTGKATDFRGWDGKLNVLKEFKKKYGHCRVPTRKKKDNKNPLYDPQMQSLAKWVEHQRSMYWKRAKGEKNSLSDERIAALNEIGMEWRVARNVDDKRLKGAAEQFIQASQGGTKTGEDEDAAGARAAELNAAHQLIDAAIHDLGPAEVDIGDVSQETEV